jgi:hypothetical protein
MGSFIRVDSQSITPAFNQMEAMALTTKARAVSAAGVVPHTTAVDSVLAVLTLSARELGVDRQQERELILRAVGRFAANANAKRVKIIVNPSAAVVGQTVSGGTTILDTGSSNGNAVAFTLQARIIRYGAAGANTQLAVNDEIQLGATVVAPALPALLTLNEAAAMTFALVGNSATTAGDISHHLFELKAMA